MADDEQPPAAAQDVAAGQSSNGAGDAGEAQDAVAAEPLADAAETNAAETNAAETDADLAVPKGPETEAVRRSRLAARIQRASRLRQAPAKLATGSAPRKVANRNDVFKRGLEVERDALRTRSLRSDIDTARAFGGPESDVGLVLMDLLVQRYKPRNIPSGQAGFDEAIHVLQRKNNPRSDFELF
ncbi:hypothetical protein M885DRAFT_547621 [Pelagophyceae sp. CCMP2097]|nr:hypothetical protein M885DRAFT_547621 [Pelagophyceae sp. CCMP2097]